MQEWASWMYTDVQEDIVIIHQAAYGEMLVCTSYYCYHHTRIIRLHAQYTDTHNGCIIAAVCSSSPNTAPASTGAGTGTGSVCTAAASTNLQCESVARNELSLSSSGIRQCCCTRTTAIIIIQTDTDTYGTDSSRLYLCYAAARRQSPCSYSC
jgi:hypothetical protein